MRFRCGQCETNYNFDDQKLPKNGIKLKCKNCNNRFTITGNHEIKANDDQSQRFCTNCGAVAVINANKCPKCNLLFNDIGEPSNIIDNRDYVDLSEEGRSQRIKRRILAAVFTFIIILSIAVYFQLGGDKVKELYANAAKYIGMVEESGKVKAVRAHGKFLVTLSDGSKIDAVQINFEEDYVSVVGPAGKELTVAKKDIVGIDNLGK